MTRVGLHDVTVSPFQVENIPCYRVLVKVERAGIRGGKDFKYEFLLV